ncbi:dCTP deaminase [Candidatus Peribacteria bacterium RIFCSPHIGHO2_02_FULL_49_16]|nr:MAG: dCTP deaminase [Candidatus Peribacteria bacterium RIFCSPHIGHO2_02_FULL_49_16]
MAVLTKQEILERVKSGSIAFLPGLDSFQLQTHAVDLRLGFTFLIPKVWRMTDKGREALAIDPLRDHGPEYFDVIELEQGQSFDLLPEEYVLVSTFETIKVPNDLMAILYPRSSVNRKGLTVDLTGIIDSGYEGPLTLPIRNNTRSQVIQLHPGERFCQIVFEELAHKVEPRKSRWHGKDVVEKGAKEKAKEMKLVFSGDIKKLKREHPAL